MELVLRGGSHLIFTQHLGIYLQCDNGCVHKHTSVMCFYILRQQQRKFSHPCLRSR